MSWHRQTAIDPTEAYLQNAREQKMLDLQLKEINKLWFTELKRIARDKLDVTQELVRIENSKKTVDHFSDTIETYGLRQYNAAIRQKVKYDVQEKEKDNFDFNPITQREKLRPVQVPPSELPAPTVVLPPLERSLSLCGFRMSSNIRNSRMKSSSDTNLHLKSHYSDPITSNAPKLMRSRTDVSSSKGFRNGPLPQLVQPLTKDDAPHRYLKHRMNTNLHLPPVKEVIYPRKLSI